MRERYVKLTGSITLTRFWRIMLMFTMAAPAIVLLGFG